MSEAGSDKWRELPTEIGGGELAAWAPAIAQPVAVTGGSGFVGSHLLETLLAAGVRMRLLVRDRSRLPAGVAAAATEVVVGDLATADALRALVRGCGTVFHLAGVLRAARPVEFDRANRAGTETLMCACREAAPAAGVVYVSSLAAAGPSVEPGGRRPEDPSAPVSAYGRSKLGGEEAVRTAAGRWVIVRPGGIYGPRDTDVFQFFRLAAHGIVPVPSGTRWVTMAHVADVVRALLAAATGRCWGEVLHTGEPRARDLTELAAALASAGDVRARVVRLPGGVFRAAGRLGDALQLLGLRGVAMTSDKARELLARHWTADTGDSLRRLGLDGFVRFEAGARATWSWYRDQGWLPRAKMRR